jgi:hypothetical protein
MRTLFCCVAALLGAAIVGVFAGSDFVYHYPDSALIRVAETAALQRRTLDSMVVSAALRCQRIVVGKPQETPPCPDHALVAPPDPTPMDPNANPETQDELPRWVRNADLLDKNPPTRDNEAPQIQPPVCPVPEGKPDLHDGIEECEPGPMPMPLIPDETSPPPTSCPKKNGCKKAASTSAVYDILGGILFNLSSKRVDEAQGSEEQSHVSRPGDPPNCREDPDYNQQYPGCPHLNDCPHKKAPKNDTPKTDEDSQEPRDQSAAPRNGTDRPARIDTTEFRPSDARPGEFGRIPF